MLVLPGKAPHPALSKGDGSFQVSSFGGDLEEAFSSNIAFLQSSKKGYDKLKRFQPYGHFIQRMRYLE
jgi:hypothetical protein